MEIDRAIDRGPWIETYTGRKFFLLTPEPDDVCVEDIAHALANIARFGGHAKRRLTVSEHSIAVSHAVPDEDALEGLLHDAAEAYIGDIVNPLKAVLRSAIEPIETAIDIAIATKLGCRYPRPVSVKRADYQMLIIESAELMSGRNDWGHELGTSIEMLWERRRLTDAFAKGKLARETPEADFLFRYQVLVANRRTPVVREAS